MRYRDVSVLDNGWVRCAGDVDDPADGGAAVDYYPQIGLEPCTL